MVTFLTSIYGESTKFRLCKVHLLRNVKKYLRAECRGNFYTDPALTEFWECMKCAPYLPWVQNPGLIPLLFTYFDNLVEKVGKDCQKGYKKLLKYLKREYFSAQTTAKNLIYFVMKTGTIII